MKHTRVSDSNNTGRRQFLGWAAASTGVLFVSNSVRAESVFTEQMIEGPLYPDKMPLDTDNDLLLINDNRLLSAGELTYLSGKVYSKSGLPVRNAFVEIWQTDANGNYIHSEGAISEKARDANFQGYGRFLTDNEGRYFFRTIKPVPYTQHGIYRTPHIHVAVSQYGKRIFTTQMVINGHPDNTSDLLLKQIQDPAALKTLMVDFKIFS